MEGFGEGFGVQNGIKIDETSCQNRGRNWYQFLRCFFPTLNASNPEKSVFRLDGSSIFTISLFELGTRKLQKKDPKMRSKMAPNPSKIVLKNVLFFDIDFLSILAPCWKVLGEVLGGFGHPREGT